MWECVDGLECVYVVTSVSVCGLGVCVCGSVWMGRSVCTCVYVVCSVSVCA